MKQSVTEGFRMKNLKSHTSAEKGVSMWGLSKTCSKEVSNSLVIPPHSSLSPLISAPSHTHRQDSVPPVRLGVNVAFLSPIFESMPNEKGTPAAVQLVHSARVAIVAGHVLVV